MKKYCGVVKLVVILIMFSLFAMIATENTLAAESSDQGSETFEDGFSLKNGILTIKKIYYTVVDVAGKSKCVYQIPWIKYKNADEITHIVIDADMVYTDKNITTGKAFKDLSSTRGDFLGGGHNGKQ